MKRTLTYLAAASSLALAMGAQAAPIVGTGSVALLGVTAAPPGGIDVGTTFSFGSSLFSGGTGHLSTVLVGSSLVTAPITATVGSAVSFTASWGSFAGMVDEAAAAGDALNKVVSIYALGTFTPLIGPPDLTGFSAGPMSLTFSATQTGGVSAAVSASYTIASPPARVPEPASLALVGLALAGAAFASRRK